MQTIAMRELASLGGNLAVTQSVHLGTKKKLLYDKFYILVLLILSSFSYAFQYDLTCLSIIIDLQARNETYRNIKHPYRMRSRINDKRQSDSINYEAVRTITAGTKLCSLQKLLADLGWDFPQERRTKLVKLVIFYKIINNLLLAGMCTSSCPRW